MAPPRPPEMAPIQRLPAELKDLICEFTGFEAHRTRDYHVSRPDETCSQNDAYIWTPHSLMPDKGLTNTQVYDDLRSLALVSRDFAAPAQRALFAIVALPNPISYFRLLRTLLLNPQNGRYIRCLIPVGPQTFDNDLPRETMERAVWKEFVQMFTPTIAADLDIEAHNHIKERQFLHQLMAEALEAVIPLCPQLRAFHLFFSQDPRPIDTFYPPPLFGGSFVSWSLSLPIGRTLFKSNPLLTTLTVDFRVLMAAEDGSPLHLHSSPPLPFTHQSEHRLPSSITHLTLIGYPWLELWDCAPMSLYALGTWLSENHGLKSLRVLNGLGNAQSYRWPSCNWNMILLKYKNSLEELEFDGRGVLLLMPLFPRNLLWDVRKYGHLRFGEAGVLSCLGQMERLKVIKVPLHYLRRVGVEERQHPMLLFTVPGVEIVEVNEDEDEREEMEPVVRREQDIRVDVEFPMGAERIEVVVPSKLMRCPNHKVITGVRTVVVRG